jgi:ribonuclease Z
MTFEVIFHPFDTKQPQLIYEDRSLTVTTIPLKHRMPSCGFLFAEKQRPAHIIREMIDRYNIPLYEINRIKNGADYQTPDGECIPNAQLTIPADPIRRYAYCSDTLPLASVAEQVKGVNLLFHEATFADDGEARARETYHTTARQAASLAKDAGVKKLLIGHFSARYDDEQVLLTEAKSIFEHTQLAREINFYSVD